VLASRPVAGVVFAADRLPVCAAPGGTVVASALPALIPDIALIPDMRAKAAARRKAMGIHRQRKSGAPQRRVAGRPLLDRALPRMTGLSTARPVRGRPFYEPVKSDICQFLAFPYIPRNPPVYLSPSVEQVSAGPPVPAAGRPPETRAGEDGGSAAAVRTNSRYFYPAADPFGTCPVI
jgi:hypothetical protein